MDKQGQEEQEQVILPGFILEKEILGFLGVTKAQLTSLRQKHELPYIKINARIRLYYETSIIEWLKNRQRVEKTA